jgi:hypothetical protein
MSPVLTAGDGSEFELIPENDQVNVMVNKVEPNNFTYDNEPVEKLRWYFTVVEEGPWKGKDIQGDTSTNFTAHPSCKAYNWAVAITGHEYPPGTDFDTDDIAGMRCRVLVGRRVSKQGREFMNVKEVMPPRGANTTPLTLDPATDGAQF